MISHDIRSSQLKSKQIVNDKFVKRLQQKRCSAQRRAVYLFSLLMTYCFLNNLDAKLRAFGVEIIVRVFQIHKKRFTACLSSLHAIFLPALMLSAYSKTSGQFFPLICFNTLQSGRKTSASFFFGSVSSHFFIAARGKPEFPPVRQGAFVEIIP